MLNAFRNPGQKGGYFIRPFVFLKISDGLNWDTMAGT
jgi:hypothetical protein